MTAPSASTRCVPRAAVAGPLVNSYCATIADAERRHRRGERQVYCPLCSKWLWPDQVCEAHRSTCWTNRAFTTEVRRAKRDAELWMRRSRTGGRP